MRNSIYTKLLLLTSTIAGLWACGDILNDDEYDIESLSATPSYSVPVAFGDLSIQDILSRQDSQYIKVYSDGLVYLNYEQTLKSQAIRELIEIPDKNNVTASLAVPAGTHPPRPNDLSSTFSPRVVEFDLAPKKLDEILLKGGTLLCDVGMTPPNANFRYAVKVEIPEFKSTATGAIFSVETSGTGKSFSLANYLYKSTSPATVNQFTVIFTLIIKQNPNGVTIAPGTNVTANVSFQDMEYRYAKGFFADQTADLTPEKIEINAFGSSLLDGTNISFADPKIDFTVINEVGVPTKVYFTSLEARKPGASLPIQINPASPVTIGFPLIMGDSAKTSVAVTNAKALLDFAPTEFYYKVNARINEGLTTGNNFVVDTSELKVRMRVEVPLYGHASNILLSDTLKLDLSDLDKSTIESAALKIKTTNQIPLSANLQFYLTDENYKVLDSLIAPAQTNLIKGSEVNASGDFVSAGIVDELLPLSSDKLEKIFKADKLIIKARVNTVKNANGTFPDVKFKSSYKMDIKIGLQVNAKIKVDL